ncbi:MAG TPA: membrane protein insertase YidC [Alphaproteobacteria bacterium]|nr:membrane protein insertase YidC [Alphaproteobacteria bacterium]
MNNNQNLVIAVILSVVILIGFQYFYAAPQEAQQQKQAQLAAAVTKQQGQAPAAPAGPAVPAASAAMPRAEIIKQNPRVAIVTPALSGSIDLRGARIDDLTLNKYHVSAKKGSPDVVLLSPAGSAAPHHAYYAELGWLGGDHVDVPTADSEWRSGGGQLTPDHPVKLSWDNGHGLFFFRTIAIDDHFMFTVSDDVRNETGAPVTLYPYGLVTRQGEPAYLGSYILHEGPLGVLDGTLDEYSYKSLKEAGHKTGASEGGWLGITDKYWLVAVIPPADEKFTADFTYTAAAHAGDGHFQSDFRGAPVVLAPGASVERTVHLFAGAKRLSLIDRYQDQYQIPHFDRAIDFGWFYFLTKPFLTFLDFMGYLFGNFGLAILAFTVMLKAATLPLSVKSYRAMARMKALQPELKSLQERFKDDKMRQQQEMMGLYKREKVNPAAGCLPTLIQIPIFFALYKVLYVSIEMRQAPFYGWIHDLSAPDPSSVFTLFGAIPWTPPSFLHIGVWPLLMGISMFLQQRLSPQPPDKSQARIFMIMPVMFTYMLAKMPAGLVIYWTWSNLLSIAQQWFVMRKVKAGR